MWNRTKNYDNSNLNDILLMNFKRDLDNALKRIEAKESEIDALKKCRKVTKFKEINVRYQ